MTGLELPPLDDKNVQPPTPQQVWSLIEKAEEMAKESPLAQIGHAAVFVDVFTGLRRGEMLALQYPDIDWFAREVIVSRAISLVKVDDPVRKWVWQLGPTKSGRARCVGVGERVLRFLADLKQAAVDKKGFLFTPDGWARWESLPVHRTGLL
jgi:integrase